MGRTLRFEFAGDCVLLVHGNEPPAQAEWNEYVDAIEQWPRASLRILVVTDEPGPDSVQRKRLHVVVTRRNSSVPTAVLTRSRVARGIVTTLSWFNATIRAFAPTDLPGAMAFLGIDASMHDDLLRRVTRMRHELAMPEGARPAAVTTLSVAEMNEQLGRSLVALRSAGAR